MVCDIVDTAQVYTLVKVCLIV